MYHNQPDRIELHDDVVGVEKSRLEVHEGEPVRLHMTYVLRPDRAYTPQEEGPVRLHSTNGVQHRWYEVGVEDPALDGLRHNERVSPVVDGQNRLLVHDDSGDPLVTAAPLTDANTLQSDAPNSAAETRRYATDLSYYPDDFNDGETEETRRMRRQQEIVDATTVKKRRDGDTTKNANSFRENEVTADEKRQQKQEKREEEAEEKREEKKGK